MFSAPSVAEPLLLLLPLARSCRSLLLFLFMFRSIELVAAEPFLRLLLCARADAS